jgi:ABC-type nitrate/sulfonate/bicarbonate transport system substrate-binding protein
MLIRNPIAAALIALAPSAICASGLALVLTVIPGEAGAADKLVLQLQREAQFEFAGYYAALWQGYYREAGLQVEVKPGNPPGTPPVDPVREVAEGRAQFGTGTVQLLIQAAQGQSLVLLAPIFQQSGAAVYYRADGDFSSPGALLAGRTGRLPASNILDLELRTALYAEAVDPDKLRSLSIEPGQALTDLASRRVDVVVGSAWELPWQAREQGIALKSFNPAGYRTEFYGDSLFTLQRLAEADPMMVRRFREASIKGWGYALQHPDEVAAHILADLPVRVPVSDPVGFGRYQTEVARKLARYPEVPLGHSNPERWSRIQESLIAIGAISRPADLEAFLYDPGTPARNGADRQAPVLGVAGAVAGLLAGAGFLWRRRQRRSAVSGGVAGDSKPLDRVLPPTATALVGALRRLADRFAASLDDFRRRARLRPALEQWRGRASAALSRLRTRAYRVTASTAGGTTPDPCPTNLNATLTAAERSIRRGVPRSISCRLSLLPEPWLCHAEPEPVAMAVFDLVAAAIADLPAGGDLIVGTRQFTIGDAEAGEFGGATGDYVRLTVKDNGPGLSAERLDCIFEPAATARPAVAAAAELTRRLGGFARVESVEGIGTAVHLYFRRAEFAAGERQQRPREDDERAPAAAD